MCWGIARKRISFRFAIMVPQLVRPEFYFLITAFQPWEPNLFRYLKLAGYYNVMFGKNDAFAQDTFNTSLSYWESLIGMVER
jgi:hypothetical protein